MPSTIDKAKADLRGVMTEIRDLAAKAETEGREFTDDERATIADRMAKGREFQTAITAASKSALIANDVREFMDAAKADLLNEEALDGAQRGMKAEPLSLGAHFTKSDEFTRLMAKHRGGDYPTKAEVRMDAMKVPGGLKALVGTGEPGGNGAGNLWDPQRLATVPISWPKVTLRDVITVGQTSSDAVFYAKVLRDGVGGTENNAAGVPEATSAAPIGDGTNGTATVVTGGVKPQSALAFSKETANVITIAHWIPATKKALSDAGQLRTLIDAFLRKGLEAEVERQLLTGDTDNGEEFNGLLNTNGLQVQPFSKNILATIRKALTKVRVYGQANAVLVSPGTAERIDLLVDDNGRPLGQGAFGSGNPSVWRTPLVEVPGLDDNTVLVGDFSTAVIWDREDATITATDSHLDFFTRNLVAILAEARAAFGVLDPALIVRTSVQGTDVFTNA
jgi:HK97 family phage major capsid protein